ncbi:MAG: hypothetical protein ACFNLP_03760 [Segatella oulorum]
MNCNPEGCKSNVKKDIECVLSHKNAMHKNATKRTSHHLHNNPKNVTSIYKSTSQGIMLRN